MTTAMISTTVRKLFAELLGTLLLLTTVIGSGIMAERLSGGNVAIALLANTAATVGGLYVLIELFAPISGAHFNPAVSVMQTLRGELPGYALLGYVCAQLTGAVLGAWLANAMFDLSVWQWSTKIRAGTGQWLGEVVATTGLLLIVLRGAPNRVSSLVAAYIGAAYWFTSSTSFANPAAVVGRMFSDSFAGIAPSAAPGFIMAQMLGIVIALGVNRVLSPHVATAAPAPTAHARAPTTKDESASPATH